MSEPTFIEERVPRLVMYATDGAAVIFERVEDRVRVRVSGSSFAAETEVDASHFEEMMEKLERKRS